MVTRLEDNKSYIEYIRKRMNKVLPKWKEILTAYEGEINNNFQIDFKSLNKKISFIKDRGLLHVGEYKMNKYISFGNLIYESILEKIPEQDPKWRLDLCTELIDLYIEFIEKYYLENNEKNKPS